MSCGSMFKGSVVAKQSQYWNVTLKVTVEVNDPNDVW